MAGHSHWANISIKKGAIDKKRGKVFGKLSKAIIVACQLGGGDPAINLRLRYAIDKARCQSMPKDNIERAIKRGTGEAGDEAYMEVLYEGYGPHGVAVLCDILTENRNRTAGEVRKIFEVHGGNLGPTNCVGYMFERKGLFVIPAKNIDEGKLFEIALEAGADDVQQYGEVFEVICEVSSFDAVQTAFQQHHVPTDSAEVTRIAKTTVSCDVDQARQVMKLLEALEDNDDVQTVTSNFEASDEVMQTLAAE
ncbi:MAG: putative transcriptional regulatory protein [Planctomycetaceae bacterium]|nr:putative transcriptional regulatory protein [Planctomycetaceae bacterium]